jgi:hypothetical protein
MIYKISELPNNINEKKLRLLSFYIVTIACVTISASLLCFFYFYFLYLNLNWYTYEGGRGKRRHEVMERPALELWQ